MIPRHFALLGYMRLSPSNIAIVASTKVITILMLTV